ncbi:hypothetical protein [Micromonospora inyonensis]|uniref:Uncharacterized protein n=1 Tax=Micromonospora inyonensis TaxID=47866 RepID=A0A1C6SEK1_9ACTN|nr:hypothetical protein [Micromonospora inyonensis]SCL27837.1 hypothetical protein GA0074694_4928 [Micromonospora inyonensis]
MRRSTRRLLGELDVLPYPERMATLARRARELAATGDLPDVLTDLRAGPRFLALTAAKVVGDRETVRTMTADPQRTIRAVAVKAAVRAGWLSADDLRHLTHDAPADLRHLVYRSLRWGRRPALADHLVDRVRETFGTAEVVALLPACGADQVGDWVRRGGWFCRVGYRFRGDAGHCEASRGDFPRNRSGYRRAEGLEEEGGRGEK